MSVQEIRHFHLFAGLGGGARGFNAGQARVGAMQARFRCIGGVDIDPAASADFGRLAGVPGTVLDLASRDQYVGIHGHEPPEDWREATPMDLHRAAGGERPHIVFLSAPCKGFSGLLSETLSRTDKYQALNGLTLRGVWLMLEAWADDPPELVLFENVPRIATRGRPLLDEITALLRAYGYAVAETVHDCGELGGLAQSRRRFLLLARHVEKVPPFLYQPRMKPLRGVGEVIGRLPLPVGDPLNPMHRLPSLQWRTWVRLAFVEAGRDWRSLNRLAVEDGVLRDYGLVPDRGYHNGAYGVQPWGTPAGTVTGNGRPAGGTFAVADPRPEGMREYAQYAVTPWTGRASTVTGQRSPGQGRFSVSDPRITGVRHNNAYRVVRWPDASTAVTGPGGAGGMSVADPRTGLKRADGAAFSDAGGAYGVLQWQQPSTTVTGAGRHDNGYRSVADPRLPAPDDRLQCLIVSEDGTWHRPFTTLELAALQSLLDPEEWQHFELHGRSDSAYRERIGNAVPSQAAAEVASVMGRTLLLAWSGETFVLDSEPVWVRPLIAGLQCGHAERRE